MTLNNLCPSGTTLSFPKRLVGRSVSHRINRFYRVRATGPRSLSWRSSFHSRGFLESYNSGGDRRAKVVRNTPAEILIGDDDPPWRNVERCCK
jgi:hypothetical protein